ncbi:MAG: DUF721 domain-containing protein [Chthonomonadaceae bacterium]|jgi:predicted nucleic acid-binding Zn ribbon protein|nr:DUF721 domain-containing protein [Chthonomonadaceae bacterium]
MKRLADLIGSSVDQKEILNSARAQAVTRQWSDVVGDFLATKSTPDRFYKGTLYIQVESPSWAQELRMREDIIVERLNELAQERLFKNIRTSPSPMSRELRE